MIIAGTGHRPSKLGGYSHTAHKRLVRIAEQWLGENKNRIMSVISGGALGWDQALATACLAVDIPFYMYLPFEGFDSKWPEDSRYRLRALCNRAAVSMYVEEPGYAAWKMQSRNARMVDRCDLVLAMWDGSSGGTANCIKYAQSRGRPIINLWDRYSDKEATKDS